MPATTKEENKMPKLVIDASMDAGLNYIASNANQIHVCATAPTTRTEAVTTNQLASGTVTSASFTKANGNTSGRKQTTAPQAGLTIDNSGTADHIAITSATELLIVTTCTSQVLTAGGTVDIAAFAQEIADAA